MARFRRSFRGSSRRSARRTNWIGNPNVAFDTVAAGSTVSLALIDMEQIPSLAGNASMNDPTLIRIRGQIGWDAAVAPNQTTGNKNVVLGAILYVAEAAIPQVHDLASTTQARFSSENILWTALGGISSEWADYTIGGAVNSTSRPGAIWRHQVWDVDVRAMRRLGDRAKVFLDLSNFSGTGSQLQAANATYYYTLRFLLKE